MPVSPLTSMRGWCAACSGVIAKSITKLASCTTEARMRRPPDAPTPKRGPAVARRDDRAHIGQRPLAGPHRIRPARPRVEPHDAVVHQDAGLRQHVAAAEARQQRRRQRRDAAVPVDRGDVRRAAFAGRLDVAQTFEPRVIGLLQRVDQRLEIDRVRAPAGSACSTAGRARRPGSAPPSARAPRAASSRDTGFRATARCAPGTAARSASDSTPPPARISATIACAISPL